MNELRITEVLKSDRLNVSKNFPELIKKDIKKVLNNYFTDIYDLNLSVDSNGRIYKIELALLAEGVKSLGSLS